jgi:hypothetical protein
LNYQQQQYLTKENTMSNTKYTKQNNEKIDLSCDSLLKIFNEDKKNLKQNLQKFFELS